MTNSEICVPLGSLAEGGEGESAVPPAVGDTVDINAIGTVSRVEGEQAYVALQSVNGQPVATAPEAPTEGMDEAALMGAATTADQEIY